MTSFDTVFNAFYDYIENDIDFFDYFNLTAEESMEIAKQRSVALMKEATSYLYLRLSGVGEFVFKPGESTEYFGADLTAYEINLLVKTMFLCYLNRDLSKLRTFQGVMTSSDLNLFSPANERKTFVEMVSDYETKLNVDISNYIVAGKDGSFIDING